MITQPQEFGPSVAGDGALPPLMTGRDGLDAGARARALARLDVLDSAPEAAFDELVALASQLCAAPVSLITLLTPERQWFKAGVGTPIRETPVEVSFCAHLTADDDILVVPDMTQDARFRENPLVTGGEQVRFYAGAPLVTGEGVMLGTLCVVDRQPRPQGLSPLQQQALQVLARQVMAQLELRRMLRDQQEGDRRNRLILESALDYAIVSVDLLGRVTSWNAGARQTFGWSVDEMVGQQLHRLYPAAALTKGVLEDLMQQSLSEGRAVCEQTYVRQNGESFPASSELMPLRNEQGEPQGFLMILRDRSAEKAAAAALQQAEDRMRHAFDATGMVGVWDWDLETDMLYAEPRFATMYGVKADAAMAGVPATAYMDGVYAEDREVVQTYLERSLAEKREFELEYRLYRDVTQGDAGGVRWVHAKGTYTFDGQGVPTRMGGVVIDITERKLAEQRQACLLEIGDRVRILNDPEEIAYTAMEVLARTLGVARAGYGTVAPDGLHVSIGRDWTREGVASVAGTHNYADYMADTTDLQRGVPVVVYDVAEDLRTQEKAANYRPLQVRARIAVPLRDNGRLTAVLFVHDVVPRRWTQDEIALCLNVADRVWAARERAQSEERQRLLTGELQHRMKNTLAMVQAIANQSLRNAATPEQAQQSFNQRLMALSGAQDLLTRTSWNSAPVAAVLESALLPHQHPLDRMGERMGKHAGGQAEQGVAIRIRGPQDVALREVELGAKPALALSLALHELATNAAKYGALSVPEGYVAVDWDVRTENGMRQLGMVWQEHGGPSVSPPSRRGFGTRLIERGLAGEFGGTVALDYRPEGVRCTVDVPLG